MRWERTLLAGLVMAAGTLFMFRWEMDASGSLERARTVALTTLAIFSNFHVGNARSERRSAFLRSPLSNPFLSFAVALALALHVGAMYFPPTQFVLRLEPLGLESWGRMALVASSVLLAVEAHKLLRPVPSVARWAGRS
jgi:Ca2+-transporting ATPase